MTDLDSHVVGVVPIAFDKPELELCFFLLHHDLTSVVQNCLHLTEISLAFIVDHGHFVLLLLINHHHPQLSADQDDHYAEIENNQTL